MFSFKIYHSLGFILLLRYRMVLVNSTVEWELVWNDEFTGNQLDLNEWEVVNETEHCDGNSLEQLQCHTSRSKNVGVKHGVLALTGYKENYLNKEFTGARIGTKRGFTYVKIEIRASLPLGALLRPAIWMLPENRTQRWPLNGEIDVMAHGQTQLVTCGLHYFDRGNKYLGTEFNPIQLTGNSDTRLADYHIYRIEWTKRYIDWYFDDHLSYSVNIDKKFGDIYPNIGQPFDRNFRLYFQLAIGGKFFPENSLTNEDVVKWNCSLFIIDYVRIFQPICEECVKSWNNTNNTQLLDRNTSSVNYICNEIMSDVRPKLSQNPYIQVKDIAFIAVIVIIVIIASIVIYFIVNRIRSLKSKLAKINKNDNWNDDYNTEKYENIAVNEYSEVNYTYNTKDDDKNQSDYTVILPPNYTYNRKHDIILSDYTEILPPIDNPVYYNN